MRFLIVTAVCTSMLCMGGDVSEFGIASWYGYPFHGRLAANGIPYDMERATAAHRTLPLGTWVRVTNLENSRSVDVRITDRGPFIDGRIIDLSRAAARTIDVIEAGIAPVRVDILDAQPHPAIGQTVVGTAVYAVQVGSFQDRSNADRLKTLLEKHHADVSVVQRQGIPVVWRVLVGRQSNAAEASALADQVRTDFSGAFVIRLSEPPVTTVVEAP